MAGPTSGVPYHTHTFEIPTATTADVIEGTDDDKVLVPSETKPAIQDIAIDIANARVAPLVDGAASDANTFQKLDIKKADQAVVVAGLAMKADAAATISALLTKADSPTTIARFVLIEALLANLQAENAAGSYLDVLWTDLEARTAGASDGAEGRVDEADPGTHNGYYFDVAGAIQTSTTVPNSGRFSKRDSVDAFVRVGPSSYPSAASLAEMLAAVLNTKMATPLNVNQLLTAYYASLRAAEVVRDGSAWMVKDRKGGIGLELTTEPKLLVGGREVALVQDAALGLNPRSRMMITVLGSGLAIDDDAGDKPVGVVNPDIIEEGDDPDEINYRTYLAAFQLQMTTGLESYSGSSNGTVTASGTTGFNPGGTRERFVTPIMRAMAYGLFASAKLIWDLAGVLGSGGRLSAIGKGSAAYANDISNVTVAWTEAGTESFGQAAVYWRCHEDWRDSYTEASHLAAFRQLDKDRRADVAFVGSQGYPCWTLQVDNHCLVTSANQLQVVAAQARFGEIQYNFVIGPSYPYSHVSGSSPGRVWSDAALLDAHGKRNAGCVAAQAEEFYAENGTWRPCEIISARKLGPRQIEVSIWTPAPPLKTSSDIVAELLDGCHGFEVWSPSVRIALLGATLSFDGATTHVAKVTINTATDLPGSGAEVWSGRSSDIAGTVSMDGNYYEGRQPGPQTGPRTTVHDSMGVTGKAWFNQMRGPDGKPYDTSNYLTVKRVPVQ